MNNNWIWYRKKRRRFFFLHAFYRAISIIENECETFYMRTFFSFLWFFILSIDPNWQFGVRYFSHSFLIVINASIFIRKSSHFHTKHLHIECTVHWINFFLNEVAIKTLLFIAEILHWRFDSSEISIKDRKIERDRKQIHIDISWHW